jgi:glycerate-2-kinase
MIIKNWDALTSHGNAEGRKIVLEILEAGFAAADPYENVKKLIRIEGGRLIVGHRDFPVWRGGLSGHQEPLVFDLSKVGNIYVVGGGKAAQRQAKAIEDVLGDLITEGQVNAKKGEPLWCRRIHVTFAGHPIPDEDSVEGARRILEIEKKARKGDIVFFTESGGGSALMCLPGPGLTLEDLQEVNRLLYFEQGASMPDTNAVRWMLVDLRGRHERYVDEATFIGIHTDEAPPEAPALRPSRREAAVTQDGYKNAICILKRYGVWDKVPQQVRRYLERADPRYDRVRPGELEGKPIYHFRVMGPEYMLEAARRRAEGLGINAAILASSLNDMETRPIGEMLAYVAREVEVYGRPARTPCVLIIGGELVVTVGKATGKGGRNQEFALSAAPIIAGSENIVIASADSDGTDGPTYMAGGIVDGYTMDRAEEAGIDVYEELKNHNSGWALEKLGDSIFTGALGTNVRDLRLIYCSAPMPRNRLLKIIDNSRTGLQWG